jgi:purine-binding chemotaxis protein CheW
MHDQDEGQSLAADTQERRVRHTGLFGSQSEDDAAQAEEIDFKMVTFSLAGKEYGIDIMMVKEIAKFDEFTYVPNTPSFVSGVYNLRGDIISVIDMRKLFNLPAPERAENEPYDGLILRLETGLIGVVVDSIAKVVGIASNTIQDPHPIFADVNLKYISGVVEHDEKLYIILDAERVLCANATAVSHSENIAADRTVRHATPAAAPDVIEDAAAVDPEGATAVAATTPDAPAGGIASTQIVENLSQTLAAVAGFYVSDLNREWVLNRTNEWRDSGKNLSLSTDAECAEFLSGFYTPQKNRLWNAAEIESARALFSGLEAPIQAWHPGCGEGYESYALACVLRSLHADAQIKVFASDNDLLRVSTAASLRFEPGTIPEFYEPYVVDGVHASSFSDEISSLIVFEFSELTHTTAVPPVSIVLVRDMLSFVPEAEQQRIVGLIAEQIQRPGIVITGRSEDLSSLTACSEIRSEAFRAWSIR